MLTTSDRGPGVPRCTSVVESRLPSEVPLRPLSTTSWAFFLSSDVHREAFRRPPTLSSLRAGMTQASLAHFLGIDRSYLSEVSWAKNNEPQLPGNSGPGLQHVFRAC